MDKPKQRLWKSLGYVTLGHVPLAMAYALAHFRGDLDVDREAEVKTLALNMLQGFATVPMELWIDRPLLTDDRSLPTLAFMAGGLEAGMFTIN